MIGIESCPELKTKFNKKYPFIELTMGYKRDKDKENFLTFSN